MTEFKSDDYSRYRIERAKETLGEIEVHIANGFWNTAVNRMYYACFYAVSALLLQRGINASSHAGIRQQFGQHFVKGGVIERELARH